MCKIGKIVPPAAGFLNVLIPFLNVSAHFEVQFIFGLRKNHVKNKGVIPRINFVAPI